MIGILAISRSSRQSVLWSSSPGAQVLGVELPDGKRNEALDCRVYAYAALCSLLHIGVKLNREVDAVATVLDGRAPPDEAPQLLLAADAGSVREVRGPSVKTMGALPRAGRCRAGWHSRENLKEITMGVYDGLPGKRCSRSCRRCRWRCCS